MLIAKLFIPNMNIMFNCRYYMSIELKVLRCCKIVYKLSLHLIAGMKNRK